VEQLKDQANVRSPEVCTLVFRHSHDIATRKRHRTTIRAVKQAEKGQQRCLSGAGSPDEGYPLAGTN
jgi:hypothetical protein